ncbi:MAG: hypothetical protein KAJ48_08000 [Elusimicrobiales bacterium]|nr:hypothetical protein [Elusimicrobiales bacterium]
METFDILNRKIFSVGTWNGDKWTEEMLNQAVKAFADTKGKLRPPLKLGHNKEQKITNGLPAIGWVDNLRKVGNDLVADFKKIPKVIYELLNAGAYRTVSAEFWQNATIDGKKYPFIFKGLALLGADLPAVDTVSDIIEMYDLKDTETKEYEIELKNEVKKTKSEDKEMEKEMKELLNKVADLEAKGKTASENYAKDKETWGKEKKELKTKLSETENKYSEMETKSKEIEAEKVKIEYTARIDKLIADKRVLPAHKEKMLTFMLDMPIEKKFKEGEKEVSYSEMLVKVFSEMPEINISTEEKTEAGKTQSEDEAIQKYMKDNKVEYKEAFIALAEEGKIKG